MRYSMDTTRKNKDVSKSSSATQTATKTKPTDIKSLIEYLNENYNYLETPVVKMTFEYKYQENDSDIFPCDYML